MNDFENQERLSRIANVLQIGSFLMNLEQVQNDEILRTLEHQDNVYFKELIENQKLILEKLDRLLEGR